VQEKTSFTRLSNILALDEMNKINRTPQQEEYFKNFSNMVNTLLTHKMIYYTNYLNFAFQHLNLIS
jgi:hypothetical protein